MRYHIPKVSLLVSYAAYTGSGFRLNRSFSKKLTDESTLFKTERSDWKEIVPSTVKSLHSTIFRKVKLMNNKNQKLN